MTKASFQVVSKDEELNDFLNKMDSGILSCCAYSLSDNIHHPSGPETLERSRLNNFVHTDYLWCNFNICEGANFSIQTK